MQAFLEEGTWSQADLARRARTTTETIRKCLEDFRASGWPLERQEEHPQVYWSMPPGWLPQGILLPKEEVAVILRLLARMPADEDRDRILSCITAAAPKAPQPVLSAWATPIIKERLSFLLQRVEDSIRDRVALKVRYISTSRGAADSRSISFQRISPAPHIRLCGHCHRAGVLKWFRLDNVVEVEGPSDEAYVEAPEAELKRMMATTVDGYHSDKDACSSSFTVRLPEARWVQQSLPPAMRSETIEDGIRVHVDEASLQQVARFVVGLGEAAQPETEALKAVVRTLAEGALLRLSANT